MSIKKIIVPPKSNDPKEIEGFFLKVCQILNKLGVEDSTATTVDELKADFNEFITRLRG